ncbi:hypothetical protein BKA67DRAFT_400473 [Truncatella angustata]|uniref:U1-type domain-containing protein n=1 Tax=Truncatella angustata TaxID=152316 RepID=A0A9P8UCU4_9PEZI|nr:uncharacterized protein BKA67DRAFT_400473 [Truncatella angustata]KAH6647899.1 hypothetical protein BKA67DRAFT_400473 [Truncatella angustata]KAH8200325.1 hypothetical protein TruAng_005478 [Truncatella angustata]
MSEYWKSTPKYWCKHCQVYVRDTKLERSNHEATGKHQGALKRFLRDLHRGHDKDEKEKERAKREIERLNGVVGSSSNSGSAGPSSSTPPGAPKPSSSSSQPPARTTEAQRQKQWEQLADMGIDVPTELRGNMAMASEWHVTTTRVIDDTPKTDENGNIKVEGVATGVRKRVRRDGEEEEEEAVQSLFKKPRKWGRDTKQAPEDDADLDALLSGTLAPVKNEAAQDSTAKHVKSEQDHPSLKKEPSDDDQGIPDTVKPEVESGETAAVKTEQASEGGVDAPSVVFKKRKPKNVRQK